MLFKSIFTRVRSTVFVSFFTNIRNYISQNCPELKYKYRHCVSIDVARMLECFEELPFLLKDKYVFGLQNYGAGSGSKILEPDLAPSPT